MLSQHATKKRKKAAEAALRRNPAESKDKEKGKGKSRLTEADRWQLENAARAAEDFARHGT